MMRAVVLAAGVLLSAAYAYYTYYQNEQQRHQYHQYEERNYVQREESNTSYGRSREKREKVINDILHNQLMCEICFDVCGRSQSIYFCRVCCSAYHFACLLRWSREKPNCPNCRSDLPDPLFHTCMCGSRKPSICPGRMPHSCGSRCRNCGDNCHPGAC